MSVSTSTRHRPAPLQSIATPTRKPPPIPSSSLPTSKSQQLARAIAAESHTGTQQYRPDSQWSEGGADVIWHGKGADRPFPSPGLPSPGVQSTFHTSTEESQGEFADADEGYDSEEIHSADDNTTFTTLSTSGSSGKRAKNGVPSPGDAHFSSSSAKTAGLAPARPRRKAPRPMPSHDSSVDAELPSDDEDAEAGVTYGHARNTSIGSSIWAGRGAKGNKESLEIRDRPPVPALPHSLRSPRFDPNHGRLSGDEVSIYSQGAASEWDGTSYHQGDAHRFLDRTPPLDRIRQLGTGNDPNREDEFEMMDTQSIYEGRNSLVSPSFAPPSTMEPERRLADGTIVPKMPPLPSQHYSPELGYHHSKPTGRSRSKKGRQNRSPILSYADGEEEEQRMVQERELRESGGMQGLQTTTSGMGPRLKKNSPAPWEMEEEAEHGSILSGGGGGARSHESGGLSSRPSMEQILSSGIKHPSSWTRQSMETFRHRSASSNGAPMAANGSSLSSSKSTTSFPAVNAQSGPGSSPLAGDPSVSGRSMSASVTEESTGGRRARTKSVSGSAAGVLKGLGLASSATPAKKASSSRLAKAFRSKNASSSAANGADGSRKESLNLGRGISSDDYAHLPPSPTTQNTANLSVMNSPYLAHSNANSYSSLSHRSEGNDSSSKGSPAIPLHPSSPLPPMPKRSTSTGMATNPTSGIHAHNTSNDGHSLGSSSSHNVMRNNKGDVVDTPVASNPKMRDQTFVPGAQMRNLTASSLGSNSASADTTADSFTPNTPSLSVKQPGASHSSPHKPSVPYKNNAGFIADRVSPAHAQTVPFHTQQGGSMGTTPGGPSFAASEGDQRPMGDKLSQDSHHSEGGYSKPNAPMATSHPADQQGGASGMSKLPSVGSHEGVPYKLISLEEARLQQQKLQHQGAGGRDEAGGMPRSMSERSLPEAVAGVPLSAANERERSLKSKKSGGFLRRFGKDRSDPMNGAANDAFGPLPTFAPSVQLQQAQQRDAMQRSEVQAPPTLSVRPMSSMFTGLAPGLIDSMAASGTNEAEGSTNDSRDRLTPLAQPRAVQSRQNLSPHSPAITVASVESNASGGDYYDAVERTSGDKSPHGKANPGANLAVSTAMLAPRSANGASPVMPSRPSTDSTHSDTSSALGLVSGFPALPATGHGATAASLTNKSGAVTGDSASLASATRQRALEIEAKMSELHAELVKLRAFAVDSGLAARSAATHHDAAGSAANSPHMAQTTEVGGESLSGLATPPLPSNVNDNEASTSQPQSPTSAANALPQVNPLMTPIPPCTQCGCDCPEQKRIQSLNELAILKGISILDRGRALKPLAGQNGSKFGGYLDR